MARDPDLEQLMRAEIGAVDGLTQRPMFGGLCFMLRGNILCAARQGRAMYRVGPAGMDAALALPGVTPMERGGTPVAGYVWLSGDGLADAGSRARLMRLALDCAATLPPKDGDDGRGVAP